MCPQETRAGAGSWVLNHHGNLTRALLSGPGLPASQGPGSWTRSFPAAGQNPLQQSPSSQPPPPAQPTPFPLENLRPASERPVVTPPGCRPSATKGTVSGGQGRRQPGSLTQADLGGTGSAASRSGLAGRFPPGPEHTSRSQTCPFLPGSSSSPPATHGPSLPPSRICSSPSCSSARQRVWRPARCQGADSPHYPWSPDGVIPGVTERERLSCPVGPLTPAQPCKPCPQQLLPVPALWSGVKWGPQKDMPASEPLEPAIMSLFENRWDLPTGAIQVLR